MQVKEEMAEVAVVAEEVDSVETVVDTETAPAVVEAEAEAEDTSKFSILNKDGTL